MRGGVPGARRGRCHLVVAHRHPSRQLLAASDDAALVLEEIQFTVLEGPCINAARTGEPVAVDDLRQELTPWPLFGAMACEKLPGVGSVYALPLFFGDYVLGSVDLLATRPRALGEDALEQASHVADAVTAALMPTREMLLTGNDAPAWEPEQVVRAHWFDTSRAVGALAARRQIGEDEPDLLLLGSHIVVPGSPFRGLRVRGCSRRTRPRRPPGRPGCPGAEPWPGGWPSHRPCRRCRPRFAPAVCLASDADSSFTVEK
ncbi:GAF domain-containing protein [Streptomyces sp. NPDC003007]